MDITLFIRRDTIDQILTHIDRFDQVSLFIKDPRCVF